MWKSQTFQKLLVGNKTHLFINLCSYVQSNDGALKWEIKKCACRAMVHTYVSSNCRRWISQYITDFGGVWPVGRSILTLLIIYSILPCCWWDYKPWYMIYHGPELHWYYRSDPKWLAWHWRWSWNDRKVGCLSVHTAFQVVPGSKKRSTSNSMFLFIVLVS